MCRRACPTHVCLCLARHVRVTMDGCYAGVMLIRKKYWYEPLLRCRTTAVEG